MTNHTNARVWILFIAAGVTIIVAGNVINATAVTYEVRVLGLAVRQAGLILCVAIGFVFLISRNIERLRRATERWLKSHPSGQTTWKATLTTPTTAGPSPLLVALIRFYSIGLILFGLYMVGISVWQWISFGMSRGGGPGWFLFYTLFATVMIVAPGFLIWSMTNAIVRLDHKLEEVSQRTMELHRRRQLTEQEPASQE